MYSVISSLLILSETMQIDIESFLYEWIEAHAGVLKSAAICTLLIDVFLIVVALVKREWIREQIKEHDTIEKVFILSFFSAVICGISSTMMLLGSLGFTEGFQETGIAFSPLFLVALLFLFLTLLLLFVCFLTFLGLAVRLFVFRKPTLPLLSGTVNWGGTPVLVVVVAYFVVSLSLGFFSAVGSSIAGSVVFIALPLFLVLKPYDRGLGALGFKKPIIKIFLLSIPLIFVLLFGNEFIYWITERIMGEFPLDELVEDTVTENPIVMSIFVGILGPVGEEIFFRGFAYQALRRKYGIGRGIVFSSLFFGAYHMLPWQIPYAFMAGCILAYVYEKTESIYPPILLHILNNSLAVIAIWM